MTGGFLLNPSITKAWLTPGSSRILNAPCMCLDLKTTCLSETMDALSKISSHPNFRFSMSGQLSHSLLNTKGEVQFLFLTSAYVFLSNQNFKEKWKDHFESLAEIVNTILERGGSDSDFNLLFGILSNSNFGPELLESMKVFAANKKYESLRGSLEIFSYILNGGSYQPGLLESLNLIASKSKGVMQIRALELASSFAYNADLSSADPAQIVHLNSILLGAFSQPPTIQAPALEIASEILDFAKPSQLSELALIFSQNSGRGLMAKLLPMAPSFKPVSAQLKPGL
ncbi:MAG: hypothetical protein NT157_03500 [Candidatus Micrarchaeota archaeon]|nr:hypothetical protein [Candidatus Micrarchaeota archaeon]